MVTIKIETNNDAFKDNFGNEVARILREIADDFANNNYAFDNYLDINGNRVATIKEED